MAKIDANGVTLRICQEASPGTLAGTEVWYTYSVNDYGDYGPDYKKTARRTFNSDRMPRKGTTSGLDVPLLYSHDFVQEGLQYIIEAFWKAAFRRKSEVTNDGGTEITNIKEWDITFNNNVQGAKAVGILGNCGASLGLFTIEANLRGYLEALSSLTALENNDDVSFDFAMVKGATDAKHGFVCDVPLCSLGDGKPDLELDQFIEIPLTLEGATGAGVDTTLNHSSMLVFFDALPDAADITLTC